MKHFAEVGHAVLEHSKYGAGLAILKRKQFHIKAQKQFQIRGMMM